MKMKSLILIFIALGCGLVASIGISQVMSQGGKSQKIEMDQILVAKDPIDAGAKLDAKMVQLEEWPKIRIPDGATRKIEEVQDKYASYRFFKGEPILQAKISDSQSGPVPTIPPGYRVTPIKVDEDTVMEAIMPGDTVDVSVFLEQGKNGIKVTGVYTILRNVRVFAKGSQTERSTDSGKEVKARTVSLLVKPEQSRELVLAYRLGKISLALRPQNATDTESEDTVTPISDIVAAKGSLANESQGGDEGVDFNRHLNAPSPNTLAGPQPWRKMRLLTPKGGSEFHWMQEGAPAQEYKLYGGGANAPQPAPAPQPAANPPSNPPGGAAPSGSEAPTNN